MECQALGIGAKTESVRQSLARFGDIASLRTIELHHHRSPDFVFDDLYEQTLIAKQQHRRFKWRNPILSAYLLQRSGDQIMHPNVRWRLRVILVKRFPRPVPARFHAEEYHAAA